MRDEFTGNPAALRDSDHEKAARDLGCTVAAIRAVAHVESAGGGFLADGRPKILFERHVFHKRTGGRHSGDHGAVSSPQRGGYLGGSHEYERLRKAMRLDRRSALESASWGKFQIMGFNYEACGHEDVESFVRAMVSGEAGQLAAFTAFLKSCKLEATLGRRDWAGFARRYNGPAFAQNAYDRRLAHAYASFRVSYPDFDPDADEAMPLIRLGSRGPAVTRLQTLLSIVADGRLGSDTCAAIRRWQASHGLVSDGIVGEATWSALLR